MAQPSIDSKLPRVSTTIFTVMSQLASECGAINLSQGFPNFSASAELIDLVNHYLKTGYNQYAPMAGVPVLREQLSQKYINSHDVKYHPESEITITSGATEALFNVISAVIKPGDEVIVFEPAYDSYVPVIELNGGKAVYVTLLPPYFGINWDYVKQLITPRTRMIIINTPHNPATTALTSDDMMQLAHIVKNTNILILSDEVYEHIVFDNKPHNSVMMLPELQNRSFVIGSFGKTFHVTGWKIGYCLAPANLTAEFRKVHQYVTFCTNTAMQMALTDFLSNTRNFLNVSPMYQQKREIFLNGLSNSRFSFVPSQGSYFQNLNYSAISVENDLDYAIRLTREIGVAAIPLSAFYHQHQSFKFLRFCFAKDEPTLIEAGKRLSTL